MIKNFLIRNVYSILFAIFMVLNFKLLKIWFPYSMNNNALLILWVALHVYAYHAYVKPAEKRLIGEADGEDKEE